MSEKTRAWRKRAMLIPVGSDRDLVIAACDRIDELESRPKLEPTLNALYASERNIEISSFWDGGWFFRLGDPVNGWGFGDGPYRSFDELAAAIIAAVQL